MKIMLAPVRSIGLSWLLFALPIHGAPAEDAGKFTLVQDGKPAAVIVTAAKPTKSVEQAVTDFNYFLNRMTGAKLPVIPAGQSNTMPVVLIGPSAALAEYGVDPGKLEHDNFIIRSGKDFLAIVGRDVDPPAGGNFYAQTLMGTANGVYKFLEDYAGVRIFMPGENGSVAPQTKTFAVPADINVRFQKSILCGGPGYKGIHNGGVELRWRWRGMPGMYVKSHGGHGWTDFIIKPEIYAKDHPEYYPLVAGQRRPDLGGKNAGLCTSNPDVRRIMLDYLKDQLKTYEVVELGAPDWSCGTGVRCECENCEKIGPTLDTRIWELHLWLAKELRQWNPKKKLMLTAYGNAWRALPGMKQGDLPDNVIIELSSDMGPLESDYPGVNLGEFAGKIAPGLRLAWTKVHNQFSVYNYFWMPYYADGPGPKGAIAQIVQSFKRYKELGVNMLYYCSNPVNWGLEGIQYYVDHRLRMDMRADVAAIVDEYCALFYGPAAKPMRAFFNEIERIQNSGGYPINEVGWIKYGQSTLDVYTKRWTRENVEHALALLAKAEKAAEKEDASVTARIALSRPPLEWVKHTAAVCRLWQEYEQDKTEGKKQAWTDAVKARADFINKELARIESGYWQKLGLPDAFMVTPGGNKFGLKEELLRRTWGAFDGPFEIK